MCAWRYDGAAMHAMCTLGGCCLPTGLARNVGVKFEHSLLLDHDPGNPRIGNGEQKEQSNHRTGAEVEKLDAQGKCKEDAGREDVDGPFKTHYRSLILTMFDGFEVLQVRSRFLDEILSG